RQFDANGNLRDWWDKDVKKKFLDRAQCIIDQYGKIKVPTTGLYLNGKLTQGENIADNGGVKQAFRAYKRFLEKQGEEKRIEGLEQYSNEQIFFIGFAMIYCGHTTQDELIDWILTDYHSPDRYRVNQVLANQPEFAAAFNCDAPSTVLSKYSQKPQHSDFYDISGTELYHSWYEFKKKKLQYGI
ncbi:peptidase family M13, partial [Teladorsagia circumcincta]